MRYQEPEFLPWDGRRVPLSFVAGYLGAGKTTLINTVLATTDRPIAIIVNDVGEMNVDARLIRKHSGDTIELSDGCVCCSLVDGFGAAFDQIRAREHPPDHVIVELSGVADPGRVLPWGRSAGFKLDGLITLVAADQFDDLRQRPEIAEMVEAQIGAADLVAVTKLDLVTEPVASVVLERVRSLAPAARVISATDPQLAADLLRIGGRRPGGVGDVPAASLFDRHTVDRVPLPVPIELDEIETMLDRLPESVVRAKGIALDASGTHWSIQLVGSRRTIEALPLVESEAPTDLVTISLTD